MKKLFLLGIFLLVSLGCTTVQSYTKPNVDFSTFKKIALVKLGSQDASLSQIVTDALVLGFRKKRFNIIEKEQLKVLIDDNLIIQSGLKESDRNTLSLSGIDAVIVGVVIKRDSRGDPLTLSLKMFDIKSGEIVWTGRIELDFDELDFAVRKLANSIPIQSRTERE